MQKIENASDSSNTVTLPEHLIIDQILPRLPVKTLIRFKSVSKLWLSTISNRQFAESHLNFSSSSSSGQFILLIRNKIDDNREAFKFLLLPYDELNNLKTPLDSGFSLCFDRNLREVDIVGSSNGLVCLHIVMLEEHEKPCSLFSVCNPATKEYCEINNPDCQQGFSHQCWFGYIPSIDDYRIVASFNFYSCNARFYDHRQRYYVFPLRIGKWKIIDGLGENPYRVYGRLVNETMVVDDVLYWSFRKYCNAGKPDRTIGFDLANEQLKVVPLMDWLNQYDVAKFFVMNGCLSLLCCSSQMRDVWTLSKHDDWSSWEKSFSFHVEGKIIFTVTSTGKLLLGHLKVDSQQFTIIGSTKDTRELSQGLHYKGKNNECNGLC